jgi:hypothetical protein
MKVDKETFAYWNNPSGRMASSCTTAGTIKYNLEQRVRHISKTRRI